MLFFDARLGLLFDFLNCVIKNKKETNRKEGRKEGRKGGREEGREEKRKEGGWKERSS